MSDIVREQGPSRALRRLSSLSAVLSDALNGVGPPLLFAFRLWASVCLALYIAFWLELDNPFWAGTSAAIVCQPQLGASLRKGWFRMIGTLIGATMIVVLTGFFRKTVSPSWGFWPCGGLSALSEPRCSATSPPTRRRSPAIPHSSLPPKHWVRREAPVQKSLWWRSPGRARSASGSPVPASFSPGPILGARGTGLLRRSLISRPRLPADLPACWRRQVHHCRTCNRNDANWSERSSRLNRQWTRRSAS